MCTVSLSRARSRRLDLGHPELNALLTMSLTFSQSPPAAVLWGKSETFVLEEK